ncbi:MAG: helix-turn-helix domain-containing protein [Ruminococcaceae bacterium]|nr:helix-turn-helix domain-containing protein [Oscillospiraceae bacterium]
MIQYNYIKISYFFDFGWQYIIIKGRRAQKLSKSIKQLSSLDDRGVFCSEVDAVDPFHSTYSSTHVHTNIELVYSVDASVSLEIERTSFSLSSGDLIIISPGEKHSQSIIGSGHYYSIKLLPNILFSSDQTFSEYKFFNQFLALNDKKRLYLKNELSSSGISEIFGDVMREWTRKSSGYELMIRANILKIFTILARSNDKTERHKGGKFSNDAINSALSYTSDNFASVTEQDVAEHCGLSLAYFSTLFKNTVGVKFGEYLLQLKIGRAKTLLLTTDKSITYIAYETGFSSSSHFIARFKELENTTPAKYRRQAQTEGSVSRMKAPAFSACFDQTGQKSGHLLVMKYRTNRADNPPWMPMFACTDKHNPDHDDLTWTILETDERWHVIIMDLHRSKQLFKSFLPTKDGDFFGGNVHFHIFYKIRFPSQYIDFAYIAYASSLEKAFEMIGDGEDVSMGYFEDDGPSRWIKIPFDPPENISARSIPTKFYRDAKGLFADASSNGISLRKIESLKEGDVEFTRIWCP